MMSAGFMATLIAVDLKALVEFPYLMGIFATEVTGEEMKIQLPPPEEAQPVIATVGNEETGFIAGDHPLAYKYHHFC
jgi:hypothetical protein